MIWFKNAIIYHMNNADLINKQAIERAVNSARFVPCGSLDNTKMGWVSPYHDNDQERMCIDMQGQLLFRIKKENKILPAPVLKQALLDKIEIQEKALNRRLSKKEKQTLKDEVLVDLIPKAFSQYRYYWLWVDTVHNRIIINTTSFKQAEDILAILRKHIGQLALTPLSINTPFEQIMSKWVIEKRHLSPFTLGDEAELKDPLEGNGIIRCKNQDIMSDEMQVHLNAGKQITKLKMVDERGVDFIINTDLSWKRIKFDSAIIETNDDIGQDEFEKRREADFFIMSTTLSNTINDFCRTIQQE